MQNKLIKSFLIFVLFSSCFFLQVEAKSHQAFGLFCKENALKGTAALASVAISLVAYDLFILYPRWYKKKYPTELDREDFPRGLHNYFAVYIGKFKASPLAKCFQIGTLVGLVFTVASLACCGRSCQECLIPLPPSSLSSSEKDGLKPDATLTTEANQTSSFSSGLSSLSQARRIDDGQPPIWPSSEFEPTLPTLNLPPLPENLRRPVHAVLTLPSDLALSAAGHIPPPQSVSESPIPSHEQKSPALSPQPVPAVVDGSSLEVDRVIHHQTAPPDTATISILDLPPAVESSPETPAGPPNTPDVQIPVLSSLRLPLLPTVSGTPPRASLLLLKPFPVPPPHVSAPSGSAAAGGFQALAAKPLPKSGDAVEAAKPPVLGCVRPAASGAFKRRVQLPPQAQRPAGAAQTPPIKVSREGRARQQVSGSAAAAAAGSEKPRVVCVERSHSLQAPKPELSIQDFLTRLEQNVHRLKNSVTGEIDAKLQTVLILIKHLQQRPMDKEMVKIEISKLVPGNIMEIIFHRLH